MENLEQMLKFSFMRNFLEGVRLHLEGSSMSIANFIDWLAEMGEVVVIF